jgi:XTP/dITP diphosphohydrolase
MILLATSNPGKVQEIRDFLSLHNLRVTTPKELGLSVPDIAETGNSLEENALIKVQAVAELAPAGYTVLADDTGFFIDALNGEPGIYVRRWRDHVHDLTDADIIAYAMERMQDVPLGQRQARMRSVVGIQKPGEEPQLFSGEITGEVVTTPSHHLQPGFPVESLLYFPQWQLMLGDLHTMALNQRLDKLTHRERALQAALKSLTY